MLVATERGRLTDLLLRPFVVAWNHGNLLPDATGEDSAPSAVEVGGFCAARERRLPVMADAGSASQGPIRRTEREELLRDWIAASAEYSRRAREALTNAADVLADAFPGRRPDGELAGAWAALGQGWATLSHAEAARGIAAAGITPGQTGVKTNPST